MIRWVSFSRVAYVFKQELHRKKGPSIQANVSIKKCLFLKEIVFLQTYLQILCEQLPSLVTGSSCFCFFHIFVELDLDHSQNWPIFTLQPCNHRNIKDAFRDCQNNGCQIHDSSFISMRGYDLSVFVQQDKLGKQTWRMTGSIYRAFSAKSFFSQAPGAEKKSSSPKGKVGIPGWMTAESITKQGKYDAYLTHFYLEPQTTNYKWLFQLDDSKALHRKCLFYQTSILNWLFGVPGTSALRMGPVIRHFKW